MEPKVLRGQVAAEFWIEEGCFIQELYGVDGDPGLSLARARVLPGQATAAHRLSGVDERYVIVSGTGRVQLEGQEPVPVGPGDVVLIPAGASQQIENAGPGELVFYCLCTPRFTPDCYQAVPEAERRTG